MFYIYTMYQKIYDFCKVRNIGTVFENDPNDPTPRVKFLIGLLESLGLEYELDKSKSGKTTIYNIILRGSSSKMVVAHHDVANPSIDNANDNSCSVINAIDTKIAEPSVHVVLLDGEEFGGLGSQRVSDQIKNGDFGKIDYVLNLELTGIGGKNFFVGNCDSKLKNSIVDKFGCPIFNTPFNDSVIFRKNGIDSCVVNPLPQKPPPQEIEDELDLDFDDLDFDDDLDDFDLDGILTRPNYSRYETHVKYGDRYLDHTILYRCHTSEDTVDKISTDDMKEFVEEVVLKIIRNV